MLCYQLRSTTIHVRVFVDMILFHKSQKKTTDFEIFDLTTDSRVYTLSECNKKRIVVSTLFILRRCCTRPFICFRICLKTVYKFSYNIELHTIDLDSFRSIKPMTQLFLVSCFYLLVKITVVRTCHFAGGTISWKVVQQNSIDSDDVEIELQQTYSWMNRSSYCHPISVLNRNLAYLYSTCSSTRPISIGGNCDNYDINSKLTVTKCTRAFTFPLNSEMLLVYKNHDWSLTLTNIENRKNNLVTMIDLKTRSKTGQLNSSPITRMPSVTTLPINTQQVIRIPMIDTDGDIVKCRWANRSARYHFRTINECAAACQTLPNAQLITSSNLDNNCTLIVNISTNQYYVIAIQIEDFLPAAPYHPSSSIPLQFVIRGINNNANLPEIIGEFSNGVIITVSANTLFSTSIIAKTASQQTKIIKFSTDIVPFGVTSTSSVIQQNASIYSATFTWTPTIDQIGTKQLYCTIATDDENRQSTQYCLNFIVIEKTGE